MTKQNKISENLEVLTLKNKVTLLEAELRQLKNKLGVTTAPAHLPTQVEKLKQALQTLKMSISLGRRQPDDNYRQLALETEIGRLLLALDGVL